MGYHWTADEIESLRINYAGFPTRVIAHLLGRAERAVYNKALSLGLRKSPEYLASSYAGRWDGKRGGATRFKPGLEPWNKGTRFVAGGRSADTRFKKGVPPHNQNPVGHERINSEGLLEIKVRDTRCTRRDYEGVHRLVWERERGPIPAGYIVVFKPGRRTTEFREIEADRLECISRGENMRRNSYHTRYPELASVIQLRGALNRKINNRGKQREQNA